MWNSGRMSKPDLLVRPEAQLPVDQFAPHRLRIAPPVLVDLSDKQFSRQNWNKSWTTHMIYYWYLIFLFLVYIQCTIDPKWKWNILSIKWPTEKMRVSMFTYRSDEYTWDTTENKQLYFFGLGTIIDSPKKLFFS
jgi:hypothetical protein